MKLLIILYMFSMILLSIRHHTEQEDYGVQYVYQDGDRCIKNNMLKVP